MVKWLAVLYIREIPASNFSPILIVRIFSLILSDLQIKNQESIFQRGTSIFADILPNFHS
jgi:hypothetical protein